MKSCGVVRGTLKKTVKDGENDLKKLEIDGLCISFLFFFCEMGELLGWNGMERRSVRRIAKE